MQHTLSKISNYTDCFFAQEAISLLDAIQNYKKGHCNSKSVQLEVLLTALQIMVVGHASELKLYGCNIILKKIQSCCFTVDDSS